MKKILISVIIVLLLITACFAVFKGISFIKIKSINDIKTASNNLDADEQEATKVATQEYPAKVQTLEDAIVELKKAKEEYENKNPYNAQQVSIGTLEIKNYKIHYLWTILGNYRKDEGVRSLTLDLKTTQTKDVYDLQFTLIGNYVSITDFLYAIEDDEELQFQIKNLKIATPGSTSSTIGISTTLENTTGNAAENTTKNNTTSTSSSTSTTSSEGGKILQATFTVQNVGITLD